MTVYAWFFVERRLCKHHDVETRYGLGLIKGVGHGVFEIVTRFDTNTYRTVYAVQIGARVYVLHAFQKKSPKGNKTAKPDVEMISRRYKEALELEREMTSWVKK